MVAMLVVVAAGPASIAEFSARARRGRIRLCRPAHAAGHPSLSTGLQHEVSGHLCGLCGHAWRSLARPRRVFISACLCLTTLTALMLFWLGKQILDPAAGTVAAISYTVLAASPSMLGLAGHATHFAAFFATAGLCLMWRARQNAREMAVSRGRAACLALRS